MPSFLGHPRATRILVPAPVYATWNPAGTSASIAISNGNLTAEVIGSSSSNAYAVSASSGHDFDNGKRYIEIQIDALGGSPASISIGFADSDQTFSGEELGALTFGYAWRADGFKVNGGSATDLGDPAAVGDILMLAIHAFNDGPTAKSDIWFGLNGIWLGTSNPVGGVNPAFSGAVASVAADWGIFATMKTAGDRLRANFGASVFAYTVPVGFSPGWGQGIN